MFAPEHLHVAWGAIVAAAPTIAAIAGAAASVTSAGLSIAQAAKKPPGTPNPQKEMQKRINAAAAINAGGLRSTLLTPANAGAAPVQRATLLGQ